MSIPAALSPLKKRRMSELETTTASSISSQKDLYLEMANIQSLGSFSLKKETIEIVRSATMPYTESHTLLAPTLVNTSDQTRVTTFTETTSFQNMLNENFTDPSFCVDQAFLLGNNKF